MADVTIGALTDATLPVLPTDKMIVSRDGSTLNDTAVGNLPISTATQTALDAKEPTITAGTTAQYWRGDKSFQTLNTTAVTEGTNLYHTTARVLATALTGLSTATNAAITAADTVLSAAGKLQKQITDALTDIATKAGLTSNNTFSGENQFQKTHSTWSTETFAATQVLDATKPFATLAPTSSFTFDSVTGAGTAQVLFRQVTQDATGGRVASYNTTNFEKAGASFPVLSTGANKKDMLTFTRCSNGKWLVTAVLDVS